MLRLPDSLRTAFKDPFGPVYTETDALLAAVQDTAATAVAADATAADVASDDSGTDEPPLIAVGDMVTYHLLDADRQPDVALIDGKTEREAVDGEIDAALEDPDGSIRRVTNPPAELTEALLVALREAVREAIREDEPVTIIVDGEEDLATLPAILLAPVGSSVVYGQPGEGMVHVAVTESQSEEARELLLEFDGDTEAALELVRS